MDDPRPHLVQYAVLEPLLTNCTLQDDSVRSITSQSQRSDRLGKGVKALDTRDEGPSPFVHLLPGGDVAVRCDGMELGVSEAHDSIDIECDKTGFVLGVAFRQLAA